MLRERRRASPCSEASATLLLPTILAVSSIPAWSERLASSGSLLCAGSFPGEGAALLLLLAGSACTGADGGSSGAPELGIPGFCMTKALRKAGGGAFGFGWIAASLASLAALAAWVERSSSMRRALRTMWCQPCELRSAARAARSCAICCSSICSARVFSGTSSGGRWASACPPSRPSAPTAGCSPCGWAGPSGACAVGRSGCGHPAPAPGPVGGATVNPLAAAPPPKEDMAAEPGTHPGAATDTLGAGI
mmetsp:Transcript_35587/g.110961  ORF Transcript_35587/g.110961 Transcript_35587/m.110961 type:complete len:250 (+) Transcript_35587:909-1658(+)